MLNAYSDTVGRDNDALPGAQQAALKDFTIAIPGMGGSGGANLIALVKLGFQKFKIADMDTFELKNFNRQSGARLDTLGRAKVSVMKEDALRINPHCSIETFPKGISPDNIGDFLSGVDLSVDALDAFAVDDRRMFFTESYKRNIPVITAGPIGFGTAFLIFLPKGPTFDEYFATADTMTYKEKIVSFFVGLVPAMLQRSYLRRANLDDKRGPSSVGSIHLCAGVVALYALKILFKLGPVSAVPYYHQFDIMKECYVVKKLPYGNRGPLQRLKILLANYLIND